MLSFERQKEHLQLVSRTFALTIPLLSMPLEDYVGLAYLMCRICDTIEDDPALSHEDKIKYMGLYIKAVKGEIDVKDFTSELRPKLVGSNNTYELDLVAELPDVVERLNSFPANISASIVTCLTIMSAGMSRQQANDVITTQQDLDGYCYSVAGVVGEMLAVLFMSQCPSVTRNRERFMKLSVCFGEGLQMTNILKDIWDDASRGVCWLPLNIQNHNNPEEVKSYLTSMDREAKIKFLREKVSVTFGHLLHGVDFLLSLPRTALRIRAFCFVCSAMAFLSMRNIYNNPLFADAKEVKITREDVASVLRRAKYICFSNTLLRNYFKSIVGDIPVIYGDVDELYAGVSKWDRTK
ncbi:MAG: squalene/phytoene synthase family protein [Succinivibrionaceae bacterium]|nr:squalene/phytoene synthase family protein [Succinivibrionaceae bacterium]